MSGTFLLGALVGFLIGAFAVAILFVKLVIAAAVDTAKILEKQKEDEAVSPPTPPSEDKPLGPPKYGIRVSPEDSGPENPQQ